MTQKNSRNWRENLEPEFSWNQSVEIRHERKDLDHEESWWYDEK
ncbi:hypothetical protein [Fibrobacter sp.]|jgi:hypothetical protein|nr:hypothetical protein [Fibrobacter sp.]